MPTPFCKVAEHNVAMHTIKPSVTVFETATDGL